MKKILFIGAKNKGKLLIEMLYNDDVILREKLKIFGIYDDMLEKPFFKSKIKFFNKRIDLIKLVKKVDYYILSIGNNKIRKKYANFLFDFKIKPFTIISKKAIIDKNVKIGKGSQIMPGSVIRSNTLIGEHCIINTNSSIDHDCNIKNYVHIMGSAALAGSVIVDEFSNIGTNATIIPNISIGKNSYIGAGSVVLKNVKSNLVVAGNPARILKKTNL